MKRRSIFYFGFLILVHQFAVAQVTRATISGAVEDETGAVLPGVSITIENVDTGVTRETVADEVEPVQHGALIRSSTRDSTTLLASASTAPMPVGSSPTRRPRPCSRWARPSSSW